MKSAAVINFSPEKGSVELREIARPAISSDEVLLEVAAVGVTAGGGLAPVAGVAGPSVITSRGGALAYRDGQTDVTMEPCAPVAQEN